MISVLFERSSDEVVEFATPMKYIKLITWNMEYFKCYSSLPKTGIIYNGVCFWGV